MKVCKERENKMRYQKHMDIAEYNDKKDKSIDRQEEWRKIAERTKAIYKGCKNGSN